MEHCTRHTIRPAVISEYLELQHNSTSVFASLVVFTAPGGTLGLRTQTHARIYETCARVSRHREAASVGIFSIHFQAIVITIVSNRIACSGAEVMPGMCRANDL